MGPGDRGVDDDRADDLGRATTIGTGTDVHGDQHQAGPGDLPSTPSWAPDGSKFAFAKRIADNGDYDGLEHSAIFVYTVATGETRQVTHPEDAVLDMVPEDPPVVGHVVSDFAPAYSPDGTTIAFVRHGRRRHGPDDTLWDKRGQNLWRVAQNGGDAGPGHHAATRRRASGSASGVWIPGTTGPRRLLPRPGGRAGARPGQQHRREPDVPRRRRDRGDHRLRRLARRDEAGLQRRSAPGGVDRRSSSRSAARAPASRSSAGSGFGAILRFAGSGDGLLHSDCTERTPSVCGLLNRLTPDPERRHRHRRARPPRAGLRRAGSGQRRDPGPDGARHPAPGAAGDLPAGLPRHAHHVRGRGGVAEPPVPGPAAA